MLKYIMKSYVMSVASYMGAKLSSAPEVINTTEENDFRKDLNQALSDWNLSKWELLDLSTKYETEKDNIKETFIDARREEMIIVIAQKLIDENPIWEFENEHENDWDDAIEIDSNYLEGRFTDTATNFTTEYAEIANKFNIDSDDILNRIKKIAPNRIELDTIDSVAEVVSETYDSVAEVASETYDSVAEVASETYDSVADKTSELKDRAIVAGAEILDENKAKERLAKKDTTDIAQKEPKTETDSKKPAENKEVSKETIVTVKKWDTLWKIAKEHLWNFNDYTKIAEINPEIDKTNYIIKVWQKIKIPESK